MTLHTPSPTSSRRLALAVLCAGMLMIILDGNIVTVALPAIQSDLGFSPTNLTWTVNAYMIAFGGLLLLLPDGSATSSAVSACSSRA
jgi:MFS family permease